MQEVQEVQDRDELLACFDATSSMVFSWLCRLLGGDFELAVSALTGTYLDLGLRTADAGAITEIDCLAAGYARALAAIASSDVDGEPQALSVQTRALLDLRVVQRREADDVAQILGIAIDEVPDVVAQAVRAATAAGVATSVADTLRRSDHWLDDANRAKCRAGLSAGSVSAAERSTRSRKPASAVATTTSSRRRQVTAWSAASLLMIVVLVTWVLPSPKVGPAKSGPDTQASSTVPTVGFSVGSPTAGYVATDLPDGFLPAGTSNTGGGVDGEASVGVFELWAEPGASRLSGKWFAVVSSSGGLSTSLRSETASRIEVNGSPGLYTVAADGVAEIVAERVGSFNAVDMVGHGFARNELETIAASLGRVSPSSPTDALLHFGAQFDPSAIGLERLVSTHTWSADIRDQPVPAVEQDASYRNAAFGTSFSVRTIPRTNGGDGSDILTAHRFLNEPLVDVQAPSEPDRAINDGGNTFVVSSSTITRFGRPSVVLNTVEWIGTEGVVINISGNVPLTTLLKAARSVRPATQTEWSQQALKTRDNFSVGIPPSTTDAGQSTYSPLSSPSTSAGDVWIASLNDDFSSIRLDREEAATGAGRSDIVAFTVDSLRPVHVYNTIQSTAIVVVVSYGIADAVRFTVAGQDPVTYPLNQLRSAAGLAPARVGAVYAYSEPQPLTVELLDANGVVLATPQGN